MSAIDLATLRAAVRFRGDYQNVLKFPNADVDREIQGAFGEFYELVDDACEGWWDTTATGATVTNQVYATLPSDHWRVKGVDLLDGGDYVELRQVNIAERNRYGTATDQPIAYRLSARGAELFPTPNAVYALRYTYTPRAPALQEAQSREWYNGWEDYVIEASLLRLDRREQRPLADRITSLDKIEKRIRSAASKRREQEPEYIPLREYDGAMLPADKGVF